MALYLDWCNIIFKDEWIPQDADLIMYNEHYTFEEYLRETEGLDYYQKFCLLNPWCRELDSEFVCRNTNSGKHYQNGFALGNDFFLHWDNTCTSKGLFLEFPSHGLNLLYKWLEIDSSKDYAFDELCIKLWNSGCRFSRVDICKDVKKDKGFSPDQLADLYISGRIVSKLRNLELDLSRGKVISCQAKKLDLDETVFPDMRFIKPGENGSTFYLGSLSNRRKVLRVYDKEKETMNPDYPFYRWEIELHAEYARKLQEFICCGGALSFENLIKDFMYIIKENNNSSNRCQVALDPEWEEFVRLEFSEENIPNDVDITPHKIEKNQDNRSKWAVACAPVIASILWCQKSSENRKLLREMVQDWDHFESYCIAYDREDLLKEVNYYLRKYNYSGLY